MGRCQGDLPRLTICSHAQKKNLEDNMQKWHLVTAAITTFISANAFEIDRWKAPCMCRVLLLGELEKRYLPGTPVPVFGPCRPRCCYGVRTQQRSIRERHFHSLHLSQLPLLCSPYTKCVGGNFHWQFSLLYSVLITSCSSAAFLLAPGKQS